NQRYVVILLGEARDAACIIAVGKARIDRDRAVAVGDRAIVIAQSIPRQPAIGVGQRRQWIEDFDAIEIRRRAAEASSVLQIVLTAAVVQTRADLDGFGEVGDRAFEIAFIVKRTAAVEMIVRGSRRLGQTGRRQKTQSYRSPDHRVKLHTQRSFSSWII